MQTDRSSEALPAGLKKMEDREKRTEVQEPMGRHALLTGRMFETGFESCESDNLLCEQNRKTQHGMECGAAGNPDSTGSRQARQPE